MERLGPSSTVMEESCSRECLGASSVMEEREWPDPSFVMDKK